METRVLPEDRLWTVEDVAYYLGVPVQTVYWWRGAARGRGHLGDGSASGFATGPRTSRSGLRPCRRRCGRHDAGPRRAR
jgi:hypothetical protein